MESWLLRPLRESNLQLFSLVSIWISSKVGNHNLLIMGFHCWRRLYVSHISCLQIHDSQPLSVKSLKLLGDKMIKEQHFTTRDFLEAVRFTCDNWFYKI